VPAADRGNDPIASQKVSQALPRGDLQRVEKRLFGTPLAIHAKLSPEEMQKILTEIQNEFPTQ
jgi:hypothetical protein